MGLLNGGGAKIFAGIMKLIYLDAILHRSTLTEDDAGGGSQSFTDEPIKAAYEQMSEAQRQEQGYADTDQRIFVLAHELADLSTDDEITLEGRRWSIEGIRQDPARAYYDIRGRTSANPAGS